MSPSGLAKPVSLGISAVAAALVCATAFGIASSIAWAHDSASKPIRQSFAGFPRQLNQWSGREGELDAGTLQVLKTSDHYIGDFATGANAPTVNLFVAYYDSLSKGGAIHSPRVCLPGNGWEFASFEEKNFDELAPGTQGSFNRVLIQKGEDKILMYYWFQQRERRTANEFSMKYYLLLDSLKKTRRDGALVRIFTPIAGAGTKAVAAADDRLQAFAQAALPTMNRYLPE